MTMHDTVLLGYAIPSGEPVNLPLRHMVVTGQTQEAGKTTTLEAVIARSGMAAVAFVTKRGEGSFDRARTIAPYFREQADWQFVASILEASRGEKLKFERAWIIRASKGARTLADVQRNVRKAMETAKGMSADVYLTLDAYLDAVVPQIDRVRWASTVDLADGLNVMDLTGLNVEMQHLVIRSTILWVLEHANNTVVVVPEAWKFIPQGRGTPVKLAAEAYIRQAAGLGNYLWLDSQDIAGVEKMILKSVPVWVLGVQRESNEIKRTLAQIPAGMKKPKPEEIATLGLGEFFACFGKQTTKVYVQPTWVSTHDAIDVARGAITVRGRPRPGKVLPPAPPIEDTVNEKEAAQLRAQSSELQSLVADLRTQLEVMGKEIVRLVADGPRPNDHIRLGIAPSSNDKVRESAPASGRRTEPGDAGSTPVGATRRDFTANESFDNETLYQAFKTRLIEELPSDPAVMRVVLARPELSVQVTRAVIEVDGASAKGRIARLIADGWFDEGKTQGGTRSELRRTGSDVNSGNISTIFAGLVKDGFLTAEAGNLFRAVAGMKINIMER